jgi:hypothetical protein
MIMRRRLMKLLSGCGVVLAMAGCGGGVDYDTAPVSGTVTCEDEPVPGGTLQFVPMNESGAMEVPPSSVVEIKPDGTYSIPDAVVGSHTVTFIRPEPIDEYDAMSVSEDDDPEALLELEEERKIAEKFADIRCNVVGDPEIEVAAGENQIDIELVFERREEDD